MAGVNYLSMLQLFLPFFYNIFLNLLEKTMQAAWLFQDLVHYKLHTFASVSCTTAARSKGEQGQRAGLASSL